MLYYILRPITRIALKAYFRRITINGLENLPSKGPLLLCSNHPTGFLEPCLMACFFPRVLHFLVRGDLFERPLLGFLMRGTNQVPIFRFVDGYEKLRNNREIMNISYTTLAEGKAILIFPEASTIEVKNLRPIKKGTARMAMETLALYPDLPLKIIPIGVNYSSSNQFQSFVTINIGKAIVPKFPADEKLLQKEILGLTREIESKMSEQLLILKDASRSKDLNDVLDIHLWQNKVNGSFLTDYDNYKIFNEQRKISEKLSKVSDFDDLKIKIRNIKDKLSEKKISMDEFSFSKPGFVKIIIGLLIFIPTVFALVINIIPALIGKKIRDKYVSQNEFWGSVLVGASMGAYILIFLLVFIVLLIFKGTMAFSLFLVPFIGLLGLKGYDYIKNIYNFFKLKKILGIEKMESINNEGKELMETIHRL